MENEEDTYPDLSDYDTEDKILNRLESVSLHIRATPMKKRDLDYSPYKESTMEGFLLLTKLNIYHNNGEKKKRLSAAQTKGNENRFLLSELRRNLKNSKARDFVDCYKCPLR